MRKPIKIHIHEMRFSIEKESPNTLEDPNTDTYLELQISGTELNSHDIMVFEDDKDMEGKNTDCSNAIVTRTNKGHDS
jgi:hypothetical protein